MEKNKIFNSRKICQQYITKILGVLLILFISSCSSSTDSDEPEEIVQKYNLNTSVTPSDAGSIEPASGEYEEGTIIELIASENVNWEFDEWDGDLSGNLNPATIAMSSDKSVTAKFKKRNLLLLLT